VPLHYRYIAIWQKGWLFAIEIRPPDCFFFAEDVVYHDGGFHLLHGQGDKISICTPEPFRSMDAKMDGRTGASTIPEGATMISASGLATSSYPAAICQLMVHTHRFSPL
jgi:hypothetical protein